MGNQCNCINRGVKWPNFEDVTERAAEFWRDCSFRSRYAGMPYGRESQKSNFDETKARTNNSMVLGGQYFLVRAISSVLRLDHRSQNVSPGGWGISSEFGKNKKQNGDMMWALRSPSHTLLNAIFTIGFFISSLDFWTKCIPSKVSLLSFVYGKISMPNPMAKCSLDSTLILNAWLQIFQYNLKMSL